MLGWATNTLSVQPVSARRWSSDTTSSGSPTATSSPSSSRVMATPQPPRTPASAASRGARGAHRHDAEVALLDRGALLGVVEIRVGGFERHLALLDQVGQRIVEPHHVLAHARGDDVLDLVDLVLPDQVLDRLVHEHELAGCDPAAAVGTWDQHP